MTQQNTPVVVSATDNANVAKLGTTALGFIVYHTLHGNNIEPTIVNDALADNGFDGWSVTGVPSETVFRRLCKRVKDRYDIPATSASRKLFALELPETDTEVSFALHLGAANSPKSHSVAQIAIVSLDKSNGTVSWSISDQLPAIVEPIDVQNAGVVAQKIKQQTELEGDKVDNAVLHRLVRRVLYDGANHIVMMRPTGGFYFVPSADADVVERMGAVIESLGDNIVYLIPQFANDATRRAIRDAASATLGDKIAELESALDDISAENRPSAIAAKMADIKDALDTANVYADLVDLKADTLRERAENVRAHLVSVLAQKNEATTEKRPRTTRREKLEAEMREKIEAEMREKFEAEMRSKLEDELRAKIEADMRAKLGGSATTKPSPRFEKLSKTQIRDACKDALATGCGVVGQLAVSTEPIDRGPVVYLWSLANGTDIVHGEAQTQSDVIDAVLTTIG